MKICTNCKSTNTAKAGLRKNRSGFVQKYFCNMCETYFIDRRGFERMKHKPEVIVDALDLRAKGMSLAKIVDFLTNKHKVTVTRATILYWQNKFGEMINNFTKSFQLSHSINSHADEMFIKCKGQRYPNFTYYWDVIDYDTKFIIADHVSLERNVIEGKSFMNKLKKQLLKPPDVIHTDNSYDYPPAIRKTFGKNKVKHIHFPAWKMKFKNNPIERFHNTVRENVKVMRGLYNAVSAEKFFTFFKNYYNFLRPHTTLNGMTPAEKAGFGKFNWYTLIRSILHIRPPY